MVLVLLCGYCCGLCLASCWRSGPGPGVLGPDVAVEAGGGGEPLTAGGAVER